MHLNRDQARQFLKVRVSASVATVLTVAHEVLHAIAALLLTSGRLLRGMRRRQHGDSFPSHLNNLVGARKSLVTSVDSLARSQDEGLDTPQGQDLQMPIRSLNGLLGAPRRQRWNPQPAPTPCYRKSMCSSPNRRPWDAGIRVSLRNSETRRLRLRTRQSGWPSNLKGYVRPPFAW